MKPAAPVLGFDEALIAVLLQAAELPTPLAEGQELLACSNRVLAEPVIADRDQPPFDRSTRDGFAVRAAGTAEGNALQVAGQVRAGERWQGAALEPGFAI